MRLRIIYAAGFAGGIDRVTARMVRAILETRRNADVEILTTPELVGDLRAGLGSAACEGANWTIRELPGSDSSPRFPGHGRLREAWHWMVRGRPRDPSPSWTVGVPAHWCRGVDACFFPSIARHRLEAPDAGRLVGLLHDVLLISRDAVSLPQDHAEERLNLLSWWRSTTSLVTDLPSTRSRLFELMSTPNATRDVAVVPLAVPSPLPQDSDEPLPSLLQNSQYLLYPSPLSTYKNHEVLLGAVGRWQARRTLVLVGRRMPEPASLPLHPHHPLAVACKAAGLRVGSDVLPLGFVGDGLLQSLYRNAWAVVYPTLEEGWGLPVGEALAHGVPVVSSAIPSLQEQLSILGGRALWFDPESIDDLLRRLCDLDASYDQYRVQAKEDSHRVVQRTWHDVARDYWNLLGVL